MFALELSAGDFTMSSDGSVELVFEMSAAEQSALDPGLIRVSPRSQGSAVTDGPYHSDAAGGSTSVALARVVAGTYDVSVRGQRGTFGAYRLELSLAGDANGDFQVDQLDLGLISSLRGVKLGDARYVPAADVDRNGVINGGDLQRASRNLGASTTRRPEAANPLDEFLAPDALSLVGVSPHTFNARTAPLRFTLTGAEFHPSLAEVQLTINGNPVPSSSLTLAAQTITATSVLVDGRNDIFFSAVDTVGRPVYLKTTLWAGSYTLQVRLVDDNGQPLTAAALVRASLSDDQSVAVEANTTSGVVEFLNMPFRTILIQAKTAENLFGFTGVIGAQGLAQIRMRGFDAPSPIDNNDFSQGTAGWNIGAAPVQVIPHTEGIPNQPVAPTSMDALNDNDVMLSTAGEGEQSISRSFNTSEGTSSVRVRYRFITSEVPGGYFGSEYNDYFRVSLRTQNGGGFAGESNSMNGLGLGAFDFASGATDWRDVTLQVDPEGDTVQVDVAVANVGDGLFGSQVIVDFVEEKKDQVRPTLAWNNTQGGMDLTYRVENGELEEDTTIEIYWASGPGYANRTGAAIFSYQVPAGTAEGSYGPVHVDGGLLAGDPAGTTHLIAASSETSVGALADVQITFGANANANVVWPQTLDILKDGLRAAGQASATITSTARSPADQARAMFQNLTNPNHTVAQNVATQLGIYAPAGDAVINVFAAQTQGMTLAQILQNQTAIRAAMEQEINNQGPSNVSRHCADQALVNVVDVGAGVFNASNGPLFVNATQGRVAHFIDERTTNNCYHYEVQ